MDQNNAEKAAPKQKSKASASLESQAQPPLPKVEKKRTYHPIDHGKFLRQSLNALLDGLKDVVGKPNPSMEQVEATCAVAQIFFPPDYQLQVHIKALTEKYLKTTDEKYENDDLPTQAELAKLRIYITKTYKAISNSQKHQPFPMKVITAIDNRIPLIKISEFIQLLIIKLEKTIPPDPCLKMLAKLEILQGKNPVTANDFKKILEKLKHPARENTRNPVFWERCYKLLRPFASREYQAKQKSLKATRQNFQRNNQSLNELHQALGHEAFLDVQNQILFRRENYGKKAKPLIGFLNLMGDDDIYAKLKSICTEAKDPRIGYRERDRSNWKSQKQRQRAKPGSSEAQVNEVQ